MMNCEALAFVAAQLHAAKCVQRYKCSEIAQALKETLCFLFFLCKIPFIERSNCVPEYCQSAKDVFYTPELYRIEIQLQGLALTWPS